MKKHSYNGYTLIELLVVISVISMLLALVVPALNRVRIQAKSVVCRSNLRNVGVAILSYSSSNDNLLPVSYRYFNSSEGVGIRHWSSLIMPHEFESSKVFSCPAVKNGGLPPANTYEDNLEAGQTVMTEGVIDMQARRCAYVLNESLCPRNRFEVGFEGAVRPSRQVKAQVVSDPANTILATEYNKDWKMLADYNGGYCRSFLPVHGFVCIGSKSDDQYDLNMVSGGSTLPCFKSGPFSRITDRDLMDNPKSGRKNPARLNFVGRNHGPSYDGNGVNESASSFLYLDGRVESTSIYDTLEDFQWGKKIYSLKGDARVKK
ncbi:MAG: type II secretion system protein [Sedimentisphaeraceae bacterium JB056]